MLIGREAEQFVVIGDREIELPEVLVEERAIEEAALPIWLDLDQASQVCKGFLIGTALLMHLGSGAVHLGSYRVELGMVWLYCDALIENGERFFVLATPQVRFRFGPYLPWRGHDDIGKP